MTGISGWMTAWRPPTPRSRRTFSQGDRSPATRRLPVATERGCGLRVGVQRRLRVGLLAAGRRAAGRQFGVLMVIGIAGCRSSIALESVRESARVEQKPRDTKVGEQAGMAEMG